MALKDKKLWEENFLVLSQFYLITSKYPCLAKFAYLHKLYFFPRLVLIKKKKKKGL
jgi:hypothetical protein